MAIESLQNTQFDNFVQFATNQLAAGQKKAIARLDVNEDPLGNRTLKAADSKLDWVGHTRRNEIEQMRNNNVRTIFKNAIADMFGGIDRVPESVKKAMKMDDFDRGKPLTARRIIAVKTAVDKFAARFQPALEGAKGVLDEAFDEDNAQIVADPATADGKTKVTREQLHELAAVAIKCAVSDEDALDVVSKCMTSIVHGGDGKFRSADGIAKKVDAILANVAELRAVANGNRAIIKAGKDMIISLNGKSLEPGLFTKMVKEAQAMKTNYVRKLSTSSSGQQIHRAVRQFMDNLNNGVNKSGANKALVGGDELTAARDFFAELHFAKCSASTLNKVRNALASETTSKLHKFYDDVGFQKIGAGNGLSEAHRSYTSDQGYVFKRMLDHLKNTVDSKCGVPEIELAGVESFEGNFDYGEIDAVDALDDINECARKVMDQQRQEFLAGCVKGTGSGAEIMRGIYDKKLPKEVYKPASQIKYDMSENSTTMIGWSIMSDCKKFAEGNVKDTIFFKDINRNNITLSNGVKLAKDFETARDQIASFITKGAKTSYAALDAKEKAKSHVVMSLLSQETVKAAFTGAALALHPQGAAEPFMYASGGPADAPNAEIDTDAFSLSLEENGSLKLKFDGKHAVSQLMSFDSTGKPQTTKTGAGSKMEATLSVSLNAKELERLADLDFSKFDDTEAKKLFSSQTEANKLQKIRNEFPKEYRLNLDNSSCDTNFRATIN